MNQKKALQDNPLLDENTALDDFFDPRQGKATSKATKTRPSTPKRAQKKALGKPKSFGDAALQKITAEIPKDLVTEFNILVASRSSRLNVELAEAMKQYLKRAS